jgi:acetoacetate decarboxylase
MTFNNKEYLNNCLKDMKATLRRLVQDAVEKDQPLDSPIIKMQEERILEFAKQIENMS